MVMRSRVDGHEHLVLVKGEISAGEPTLVRVQSIDLPADLVGLTLSGGGAEMRAAMDTIAAAGKGVFVYLVRGPQSTMSAKLERVDVETTPPTYHRVGTRLDLREFGIGAQILKAVGVRKFRLISNHDVRIVGLEGFGLEVVERVPLPVKSPRA
jgi:3,4-dihydroxy 2-butanone 4-phosphate synthase/GTP cyclohydrolase II